MTRIFKYLILGGLIYYFFPWILYLFLVVIIIIIHIVISLTRINMLFKRDPSIIKTIKDIKKTGNDFNQFAKKHFYFDLYTRFLFIKILENFDMNKTSTKSDNEAIACEKCFTLFKLQQEEILYITKGLINNRWKELIKIYHPDKYQDDEIKKQMTELAAEINNCKDLLFQYINQK